MGVLRIPHRHIDIEKVDVEGTWYRRIGKFIFKMDHSDINRSPTALGTVGVCNIRSVKLMDKKNSYIGKVYND